MATISSYSNNSNPKKTIKPSNYFQNAVMQSDTRLVYATITALIHERICQSDYYYICVTTLNAKLQRNKEFGSIIVVVHTQQMERK